MRVKIIIEYDGTNYSGWQRQTNSNSIQETIENALYKLTNKRIVIHGAGRTDAGVHAIGQVFHFDDDTIEPERYSAALNCKLPKDMKAVSSEQVSETFHSRFSAVGKHYKYIIKNTKRSLAIERNLMWQVHKELNINNMKKAAKDMLGEHDFSAFMAAGSFVNSTIRCVDSVEITKRDEYIIIDVKGNGFLRSMIRVMAGCLVEVGYGKKHHSDIKFIIASRDRLRAGVTAPACGLYMVEIYY